MGGVVAPARPRLPGRASRPSHKPCLDPSCARRAVWSLPDEAFERVAQHFPKRTTGCFNGCAKPDNQRYRIRHRRNSHFLPDVSHKLSLMPTRQFKWQAVAAAPQPRHFVANVAAYTTVIRLSVRKAAQPAYWSSGYA